MKLAANTLLLTSKLSHRANKAESLAKAHREKLEKQEADVKRLRSSHSDATKKIQVRNHI